jgi:glycosyltransferase involved in cell wall biosynthesis
MGGAEKLIVDIVPRLWNLGQSVDVCVFNGVDSPFMQQLEKCGCRVYKLSYNTSYYHPIKIFKLWRIMRHYDVVHTHCFAPQIFAAIASVLCRVKLVTTEHNTSNRRRDWRWYPIGIDRWVYNRYGKIICISRQAEYNLRESIGFVKAEIVTIFNGVDVELFHNASAIKSLRSGGNKFILAMIAAFRYQKDQDTLIKAMTYLDPQTYELWLVGDGVRRPIVESLAKDLCVADRVVFMGLRTDIPEILHSVDVVVMSSHFEGLSLSNIEGMSVGKPFVGSDVDGLREMTNGYGILFPHGDEKALAEIIMRLHDNHILYEKIASRCYERAKQFDISEMVSKYNGIYEEIANS